jgi:FecR protein
MTFLRCLLVVLLLIAGAAPPAYADWIVARVSQPTTYATDGRSWRRLTLGMDVPNNAWIHTGRRGRLLLRRSNDLIQFKPNTVAAISSRIDNGHETTTIFEKFGSILIDVEPRSYRSHTVETPFLAATVKGTRFEMDVDLKGANLRVIQGVVEVTHRVRGERVDVITGQHVRTFASVDRPLSVRGRGPKQPVSRITPTEPPLKPARPSRARLDLSEARRALDRNENDGARTPVVDQPPPARPPDPPEREGDGHSAEPAGDGGVAPQPVANGDVDGGLGEEVPVNPGVDPGDNSGESDGGDSTEDGGEIGN